MRHTRKIKQEINHSSKSKIKHRPTKWTLFGNTYWYFQDKLHREDGPALIEKNGAMFWYLYGLNYTLEEFVKKQFKTEEEKILFYLVWK